MDASSFVFGGSVRPPRRNQWGPRVGVRFKEHLGGAQGREGRVRGGDSAVPLGLS